jgi:hypothetical protein
MVSIWTTRVFLLLFTVVISVVVGYWVGHGQLTMLMLLGGIAVLAFVTTVPQQRAWVLIPLTWSLTGSMPILGLPFSPRHLGIMLATCAYIGYRVLTRAGVRQRFTVLDAMVWLNLGWFFVTYIIHPAGFSSLGTASVGGRAYIEAALTAVVYWLIVRMPESVKTISRIPYLMLVSAMFVTAITVVGYILPGAVPYLYRFYTAFDWGEYFGSTRLKGLVEFGAGIIPVLCAYYRPRSLFNPLKIRFYLLLLGLACILASGFRNRLLEAMAMVVIAALFHRGWRELFLAGIWGSLVLAVLIVGHGRLYDLPQGMQRTLSFLPGQWDPTVLADVEESSSWRFELWQRIISEKAINNWWVGDGMGISLEDLSTMHAGGGENFTQNTLITGYYHNGPLTAIRYAGVIGLVLFYCLMITAAVSSFHCVQQCRGTPLFPVSIYLASLLIWFPFYFTFIFGSFNGDISEVIFLTGLLRLVTRTVEQTRVAAKLQPYHAAFARRSAFARVPG